MDFVQTMKDWRRMCQYMYREYGNSCCDKCRLGGCSAVYEMCGKENFLNMERDIVAWAAEHPEPQYPTWTEWLSKQGFVELKEGQFLKQSKNEYTYECKTAAVLTNKAEVPIPADIAQKLGIEPKEG